MKFLSSLIMAGLAAAAPATRSLDAGAGSELEARQLFGTIRNELEDGSSSNCPKVILVYARGSTETGNMGNTLGPILADALEDHYGNNEVWVQGVGSPYEALLSTNALPRGTTSASIDKARSYLEMAHSKCPNSALVAGGYSQGSAVVAGAVEDASSDVQDQIKGVVFFGYTQNAQNDGGIPGFPDSKVEVYCAVGDLVCNRLLIVTAAHLTYSDEAANEAPDFLISKIG